MICKQKSFLWYYDLVGCGVYTVSETHMRSTNVTYEVWFVDAQKLESYRVGVGGIRRVQASKILFESKDTFGDKTQNDVFLTVTQSPFRCERYVMSCSIYIGFVLIYTYIYLYIYTHIISYHIVSYHIS